jgi:hypothetical protein
MYFDGIAIMLEKIDECLYLDVSIVETIHFYNGDYNAEIFIKDREKPLSLNGSSVKSLRKHLDYYIEGLLGDVKCKQALIDLKILEGVN